MDYGQFAGRRYDDVEMDMAQLLDAWTLGFTDQSFPGGESPILAQHRIRPFAQRVKEQARQNDVAIVAHGRINRVLIATLTGAGLTRLEEFPQSNASITSLHVEDDVRLEKLNDTTHLALTSDASPADSFA
jgi:broad specificity phosphatase PhoE